VAALPVPTSAVTGYRWPGNHDVRVAWDCSLEPRAFHCRVASVVARACVCLCLCVHTDVTCNNIAAAQRQLVISIQRPGRRRPLIGQLAPPVTYTHTHSHTHSRPVDLAQLASCARGTRSSNPRGLSSLNTPPPRGSLPAAYVRVTGTIDSSRLSPALIVVSRIVSTSLL